MHDGSAPSHDRPFFRRSGLPVQMIRPERGCMQLSCVCGWDWLVPLLSAPVTASTLQGMASVRSGQAPAWLLVPDRRRHRGSAVKCGRRSFPEQCRGLKWVAPEVRLGLSCGLQ